jgi:hypothetical protein
LQLDFGVELALDANLAFQKFSGSSYFQRIELLDLRGMKVDASGRVSFAYPQLANGKVLDVKEHVFSASAHRFVTYHY